MHGLKGLVAPSPHGPIYGQGCPQKYGPCGQIYGHEQSKFPGQLSSATATCRPCRFLTASAYAGGNASREGRLEDTTTKSPIRQALRTTEWHTAMDKSPFDTWRPTPVCLLTVATSRVAVLGPRLNIVKPDFCTSLGPCHLEEAACFLALDPQGGMPRTLIRRQTNKQMDGQIDCAKMPLKMPRVRLR